MPVSVPVLYDTDIGSDTDDMEDPPNAGSTIWEPSVNGPRRAAVSVDTAAFLAEYFAVTSSF